MEDLIVGPPTSHNVHREVMETKTLLESLPDGVADTTLRDS